MLLAFWQPVCSRAFQFPRATALFLPRLSFNARTQKLGLYLYQCVLTCACACVAVGVSVSFSVSSSFSPIVLWLDSHFLPWAPCLGLGSNLKIIFPQNTHNVSLTCPSQFSDDFFSLRVRTISCLFLVGRFVSPSVVQFTNYVIGYPWPCH